MMLFYAVMYAAATVVGASLVVVTIIDILRPKPRRSSADLRAIEFAEYLAKAAERYRDAIQPAMAIADSESVHDLDAMSDELVDSFRALNSAICEFRKRAMRAVVP